MNFVIIYTDGRILRWVTLLLILAGALSDYVFGPFMNGNSLLSIKIGEVIGAGAGRGIALLILMAGMALSIVGIVVSNRRS